MAIDFVADEEPKVDFKADSSGIDFQLEEPPRNFQQEAAESLAKTRGLIRESRQARMEEAAGAPAMALAVPEALQEPVIPAERLMPKVPARPGSWQRGVQEFLAETGSTLSTPATAGAIALTPVAPEVMLPYFGYQGLKDLPEAVAQVVEGETPAEKVKGTGRSLLDVGMIAPGLRSVGVPMPRLPSRAPEMGNEVRFPAQATEQDLLASKAREKYIAEQKAALEPEIVEPIQLKPVEPTKPAEVVPPAEAGKVNPLARVAEPPTLISKHGNYEVQRRYIQADDEDPSKGVEPVFEVFHKGNRAGQFGTEKEAVDFSLRESIEDAGFQRPTTKPTSPKPTPPPVTEVTPTEAKAGEVAKEPISTNEKTTAETVGAVPAGNETSPERQLGEPYPTRPVWKVSYTDLETRAAQRPFFNLSVFSEGKTRQEAIDRVKNFHGNSSRYGEFRASKAPEGQKADYHFEEPKTTEQPAAAPPAKGEEKAQAKISLESQTEPVPAGLWVDSNGNMHPVRKMYEHEFEAKKLLGEKFDPEGGVAEYQIDKAGYARGVYDRKSNTMFFDQSRPLSRLQERAIKDWAIEHNVNAVFGHDTSRSGGNAKKTIHSTEEIFGDESVNQARYGTASGLPPTVPDRGSTFASELMEASRQLDALVRSRATLRPGVLGQFVRTAAQDRIEVGDIRNQATTAHEIGHAIDAEVFSNHFPAKSQASLAQRVGTGTRKELFNELKSVSELMRGPMTGTAGHIQYRKSATELIADWFSLYAHDPAQARSMAPKFTAGFEKAIQSKPEAKAVVDQLLAGNLKPEAPFKAASLTATGAPTALPGKVPARPLDVAVPRDRAAAMAAQGLVKDAVRTLEAKLQGARILADSWRKAVKDSSQRNDVGAFIEGIGNLEKRGDTIADVEARMTPAMQRLAKDYRFRQELQRQEINRYLKDTEQGEYLKFLEDYLGHFYADGKTKIQSAMGRFIKESPHAKERKLPTLKEAVDIGLTPITQDPATTYELTAAVNWRVATNRKFVGQMGKLRTVANEPAVVPAKDAPPGWHVTDNPLIRRVYARQTPGGTLMWQGGAAIHPDVWYAARQILDTPTSSDLGRAYDAINAVTRANAFAFSFFHDISLRAAAGGQMFSPYNPIRGLARIMERDPVSGKLKILQSTRTAGKRLLQQEDAVMDAAQHGLKFSWTDSEAYQKNARDFLEKAAAKLRDVPYLGKAAKVARDLQQMRQEGLWKNTHDAFKMIAYHDAVSKALSDAPPGIDPTLVKERVASLLNDAFGGQEWASKFWLEPKVRQMMSRFLLAPDWTLSTVRSVPGVSDVASAARSQAPKLRGRESFPTSYEGTGNLSRLRFWGGEVAAIATATIAAQYAINKMFGDDKKGDKPWVWENEYGNRYTVDVTPIMRQMPWHDPKDQTRRYVNLGKRAAEIVRWVSEPMANIESKAARPIAEIFRQVTGTEGDFKAEWKRDHESFLESLPARGKSLAKEFLPFSLTGTQFVLSVPMRKGMTKYKAEQAYESVYEVAANPNRFKSFLRGQPASEGTLREMVQQITDAAEANGVRANAVRQRALSIVRGHHYDLYFKAMQAGDQEKMAEEKDILFHRLGATPQGMLESLETKQKMNR